MKFSSPTWSSYHLSSGRTDGRTRCRSSTCRDCSCSPAWSCTTWSPRLRGARPGPPWSGARWCYTAPPPDISTLQLQTGAATPVWQVWQLPYLGFWIFQKQVTQWAKSGDIGAKNRKKWPKNLSNGQKKQVSPPLPSLPKWGNAAPGVFSMIVKYSWRFVWSFSGQSRAREQAEQARTGNCNQANCDPPSTKQPPAAPPPATLLPAQWPHTSYYTTEFDLG